MNKHLINAPCEMTHIISRGKIAWTGQIPSLNITGKGWFKKLLIDKLISEELLEMFTQKLGDYTSKRNRDK